MNSICTVLCFCLFVFFQIISGHFLAIESGVVCFYLLVSNLSYHKFNINFKYLFAPQNFAFIIFFFRLYIIPCIAIFYGYPSVGGYNEDFTQETILQSYIILLFMYISFISGWTYFQLKPRNNVYKYKINHKKIYIVSSIFLLFGIFSLIIYFRDINTYLSNIYLSETEEIVGFKNKIIQLCSIWAKFFLPFAILGYLTLICFNNKNIVFKFCILFLSAILILFFSLNSNRQSMVYPLLTLFAAFTPKIIKIKPIPAILCGIICLYFLIAFADIRTSPNASTTAYSIQTQELAKTVELYAGGAHMITPVIENNEFKCTIINSFFHSLPAIGKLFRDHSGLTIYNQLYFGFSRRSDLVFHTQSECYMNGGYILVILFFILIGYFYAYLNHIYIHSMDSQLLFRAAIFYIAILFNSSILQSFQVMGQFLFYNAIPALIILFLYRKNIR